MPAPHFFIEPLDSKKHDRDSFDCGEAALNRFLKTRASREAKANLSVCFVLVEARKPTKIVGFYTLSNASIELTEIPPALQKKLRINSYESIGVTLLGRMARSLDYQGKFIGHRLIASALTRSYQAIQEIGSVGMLLDPKNEKLESYYARFGFIKLPNGRMFMSMKAIGAFLDADQIS